MVLVKALSVQQLVSGGGGGVSRYQDRRRRSRSRRGEMLMGGLGSVYTTFLDLLMVNTNDIRAAWTKECIG